MNAELVGALGELLGLMCVIVLASALIVCTIKSRTK